MARKSCVIVFFVYLLAYFIFFLLPFELDILSLREAFFLTLHGALITSLSYSYLGDALNDDGYFHLFLF